MNVRNISTKLQKASVARQQSSFSVSAKFMLMLNQFRLFAHRAKSRQQLARLNTEQLRDIGLTENQAKVEANKFFWQ